MKHPKTPSENTPIKEENLQATAELESPVTDRVALALRKEDIKYRGPLSYRGLRITGWLCFALSQLAVILSLGQMMGATGEVPSAVTVILGLLGAMMMPLFVLANFSLILRNHTSYKRVLLFFGGMTLVIILAFYIVVQRYTKAVVNLICDTPAEAQEMLDTLFGHMFVSGINVFLDLFLCTLFAFFLNYRPKKFFTGKKIAIFRCFALLPLIYTVGFFIIKYLNAMERITVSTLLIPLFPSKSFIIFVAFAIVALYIKFFEVRHVRKGCTLEEVQQYEQTNRNSLRVSIVTSIVFALCAIVDVAIYVAFVLVARDRPGMTEAGLEAYGTTLSQLGFGQGLSLLLVIPFVLLFSYTREVKHKQLDKLVPIGGIAMVLIVFAEGIYFVLTHIPKG